MIEGNKVWEEHGDSMEHGEYTRIHNQFQSILGMLSSVQMQPGYIWLIPISGHVKKYREGRKIWCYVSDFLVEMDF